MLKSSNRVYVLSIIRVKHKGAMYVHSYLYMHWIILKE